MISKRFLHALTGPHHDPAGSRHAVDRVGEFAEFGIGKFAARDCAIGFEEFDRHLALACAPLQMRGLAADISDQT